MESEEDEEMFVEIESDELDSDSTEVDHPACSVAVPNDTTVGEATTYQSFEVSSSTAVTETDCSTVVISSSESVTAVCESDEVLVLSSSACEYTMSDNETSSEGPSKTASVRHRSETGSTVLSHAPTLLVETHTASDNQKLADVSQATSVLNLQKIAACSGLKDLRIVLTRFDTMPVGSTRSSSVIQQAGTELSVPPNTAVDEVLCYGVGVKRLLDNGNNSDEGIPLKQQKIDDNSSSVSLVTCDNVSTVCLNVSQPSAEHLTNTLEKNDTRKPEQEVADKPIASHCMAAEDVTIVGQSVIDVVSSSADVIVVSNNLLAADRLAATASASNTEHICVMDNRKSEQEVTGMSADANFMAAEDLKTREQLAIDGVSSMNDAIADAIADVVLVSDSDNWLADDNIATTASEFVTDNNRSKQEVTDMSAAFAFLAAEDVKADVQPVIDAASSMNDAIADAIVDFVAVSDSSLAADSLASTASASDTIHLPVMDNNESAQEVTVKVADSDFTAMEDVKTDVQSVIDGMSSMNDAIADAIADVMAVSDSSLAADSLASATSASDTIHFSMMDNTASCQEATTVEMLPMDDAAADVIAANDNPLVADSSPSTAVNRTEMVIADIDTEHQQKVTGTLNADVVTGSRPLTRSAQRALFLPPPPSVTNAGSKMRMRMEAANKEKLPASPTVKAYKKSRLTTVESTTVAGSVDAEQNTAVHNKDAEDASSSDEKLSELSDHQGIETPEQSQLTDEKKVLPLMDWRPPPTKSAAPKDAAVSSSIPTIVSGVESNSTTNWRSPPTRTSAQHASTPTTSAASLLDWKPAPGWRPKSALVETGQWSEGNTESSVSPLQSQAVNSPLCTPQNVLSLDVDMRQRVLDPSPNLPVPVPGPVPLMVMSQPPPSVPLSNVQLQNTSIAPVVPSVVGPPGVPPGVVSGGQAMPVPVQLNHGQPPPQIVLGPAPAVCPPCPVQPPMVPPPALNCQAALPGAVTVTGPVGPSVSPGVVRPPPSSVHAQTLPHIVSPSQQPPPTCFSQPPPTVMPVPAPNASPQLHVGLSPGHTVSPSIARPVTPVAQPPPLMAIAVPSKPLLPTPVRSPPPTIAVPSKSLLPTPVRPPPTSDRFGPNQPPHPGMATHPVPPPQPVPPVYHPPPQQFGPSREPPPPGVGPMPPVMGPGMAPGLIQPPPHWGPVPPPHAAPPMWHPPPQGIFPPGFNQPYPGIHHPAVPPEWRPPLMNPPGAPYMQPGLPGQNWRPPMDYLPHDGGWWPPPAAGMPQWGPPQAPPGWFEHNTGTVPSDGGGNAESGSETTALAQAAREWAEWQQRYAEWYYTYYGAAPAPIASTANFHPADTDLRQQNSEKQHKTSATLSSAPTKALIKEIQVSKSSASAIPLPTKQAELKPGTAAAFAKFAEKAASNINYALGVSSNTPPQNTVDKSKTTSTNISSTLDKSSQGECF